MCIRDSRSPSKQADPDLFLHVVERTADGVYVTGAKAHQTGYLNSHYAVSYTHLPPSEKVL